MRCRPIRSTCRNYRIYLLWRLRCCWAETNQRLVACRAGRDVFVVQGLGVQTRRTSVDFPATSPTLPASFSRVDFVEAGPLFHRINGTCTRYVN